MSKSKGNVVNPNEIFEKYGADTLRMYLMFIGPWSEGGDWSDKGIVGIYRFLNRIWRLAQSQQADKVNSKLESLRHKTIKKVTEDVESLHYNTAIAALMEYSNAMGEQASKKDIAALLIMLAPFAPHVTEELWEKIGNKGSVHNQKWPVYEEGKTQEKKVRLILQVNGKVRDVIEVNTGLKEAEAKDVALKSEKIQKWLEGKRPQKVIFVADKLVNVVV